jgi:hypothetical protein
MQYPEPPRFNSRPSLRLRVFFAAVPCLLVAAALVAGVVHAAHVMDAPAPKALAAPR